MNPITATLGPLDSANAQLFVASNTPAAAGNLTLTGTSADVGRRVLVTHGNETSERTILIVGTNQFDNSINEVVTIPSGGAGTVATKQDFETVTQARVYAAWSAAMSVGTNGVASTPWFVMDIMRDPTGLALAVVVTGTVNYSIEETYDDPNWLPNQPYVSPSSVSTRPPGSTISPGSNVPPVAWPDASLVSKTESAQTLITQPFFAWRVTINSGTGSIKVQGIQAGLRGG